MAYRRRQVVSRSSTFKEEINVDGNELSDDDNKNGGSISAPPFLSSIHNSLATPSFNNSLAAQPIPSFNNSLAAQAIKASAARRDPSHSLALTNSSLPLQHDNHNRSKSFDSYGDASKSGFWDVLAQKAKDILDDDNPSTQVPDHEIRKLRSQSFNTKIIPTTGGSQDIGKIGESHLKGCEDIRLQLETLLAEKARLASENEVNSRENRFLREIVEYHQLTMQDVVHFDQDMEDDPELYGPIDTTYGPQILSPRSQLPGRSMHSQPPLQQQQQQDQNTSSSQDEEATLAPCIPPSVSKDQHA
ncbi:hypothetical protein RYX36_023144 [Vicia faba]